MKTKTTLIALITAFFLVNTACNKTGTRIKGNGNVTTETRSMPAFNKVVNEGSFDVYIIQDSVYEVTIEAESNLISSIRTNMSGSTLIIDTKDNLKNTYPMKLYIRTPDVNGVSLSGSGIIDLGTVVTTSLEVQLSGSGNITGSVDADDLSISINGSGDASMTVVCTTIETSISGSGSMQFNGSATIAHFNISGSGAVKAYEFELKNCYTNISGSGDMFVNVSDILDVKISGSGSIYFMGYPQITSDITGSGSIISVN